MSRIVVDLPTNDVLQVEKTPDEGVESIFNGRYSLPIPEGSAVEVNAASYVLPQDGGDLASECAAALLARYPMYAHIAFNYLLEAADVADLDLAALGPSGESARIQTGRGVGPGVFGQAPCSTAILPQNNVTAGPPRPGCVVTDTIDIGPVTGGAGADEFMVWWQLYEFDTDDDVRSNFGATLGQNDPAYRNIIETDQEPAGLTAYISNDDGVTWVAAARLEPTDLGVFDTAVRIAFVNTSTDKLYLAAYAILF